MSNLIDRQAALNALGERPVVWSDNDDYTLGERNQYDMDRLAIETVPSAQLAQDLTNGCTDTISRVAAISICDNAIDLWNGQLGTGALVAVRDAIMALPSAQPVVISKSENTTECEDAVSREAVLNEIHRYMEERDYTIGLLDDNVCGLPPVTPKQPGWIPCSERLPEEDTEVLISYRYKEGEGDTDHVNIDITSYGTTCFGGREIHTLKEWRQPFDYFHANYEVIAWMPLPTPYREGGQDGKN